MLPKAERDALADFAGKRGVSMFMVLHAGLAALLHRVNGADDVVATMCALVEGKFGED